MSYRVDIPTLSANEVYTLTFEYGGTETIQLVVGDLTLETTDRRVVFTTTSPVNYIESNMNLTNLNIYEGYYESDDFGGEYTQESYIAGRSLVNLYDPNIHYKQNNTGGLTFGNSSYFQKTITEDGFINCKILNADAINSSGSAWQQLRTYSTMSQGNSDVFTVILFLRKNNVKTTGLVVKFGYGHKDYDVTEIVKGDIDPLVGSIDIPTGQTGIYHAVIKRGGYSSVVDTDCYRTSMEIGFSGDWKNGELEYSWVVLEGDHHDEFVNGEINYFTGIGCVKSPTIISHEDSNDLFYIKDYICTVNGGTVYSRNGKISFSGYFWTYTNIDIINGGVWNDKPNCYYEPGTYYLKAHYKTIKPRPNNDAYTANFVFVCADGTTNELIGMPNVAMGGTFNTVQQYTLTVTSPIVKIYYKIWYGRTRDWVTIENVSISKVNREYVQGEEDNVILETSVVSTPDDLELLTFTADNKNITDVLDLTTGIATKNVGRHKVTDISKLRDEGYDANSDLYCIAYSWSNCPNIVNRGNSTLAWNSIQGTKTWNHGIDGMYCHGMDAKFQFRLKGSTRGITSSDEARQYLIDNGLELLYEQTPVETQLSINPLKSYRNGSITTSSQQLAPTLKTTLPISNKFTTTNLTSGSTYNVYFDGTATKIDAGGTIITNPISPCEVECGGTTLTIEGTDIQNVRVLETTVKNEVGNNGTSDVELSRIKTKCAIHNIFDDYFQGSHNTSWAKDWNTTSTRDDNKVIVTGKGFGYAGFAPMNGLTLGTYKFHCKVKVQNIGDKYRVLFHNNPNGAKNDTDGFAWAETTSTQLVEEINYVGYFRNANCALFYAYNNGQVVEYYDISLIKLSDEDITGTDTSSINYSQVISDLEQPIKLRSLGTTYDSYNPATGELIKRIGVSETDGSYSVLSSPIVNQVEIDNIPHLYTNGQVKVYSDSEVYPTTILNGQSTNNYEINELSTSNNYTIRYDGECESINLAKKSNTQGTNRIIKTGAASGNLTFVNDSGDIDNVLLVQNDVREQEIKHFNGLQTVEINQLFVSNKQNLFEQYMKNDFEFLNGVSWGAQAYGSLHNGVFKCGNLSAGENLQWGWNLIKPYVGAVVDVIDTRWLEENPILLANKTYNISFNISIVDHHTVNGNHNYNIRAFDFDGNEVIPQQATGGRAWLSIGSNGVTNPTPTNFINLDVIFSKDVYCLVLHADYGGAWKFDCTITDFTICEPENAKPNVPLVYEYIDLPQPVQLNSLLDGTHDTYNPITGEYVQNVGYVVYDDTTTWNTYAKDFYYTSNFANNGKFITYHKNLEEKVASQLWNGNSGFAISGVNSIRVVGLQSKDEFLEYMKQYPLQIIYGRKEPIITQLTPINIPTFEGGILQLITTDGKVFPMIEYSMPTNNRYDTSSWESGKVYTQRNMTEAYFNESTTPMIPTETMTLTTDHISSGSIILNDNGNGLIVLNGDYTGRDIPYFTGMRSVEAIEVETTPNSNQPLFGKGGRK